jgi:putative lipoic acid-binding regulatory protein
MDACRRPEVEYPTRIPLKVIGQGALLQPEAVAALIARHLGPQPEADRTHSVATRGPYTSLTFWVTLPDGGAELPLRTAIQALPGVVMQL